MFLREAGNKPALSSGLGVGCGLVGTLYRLLRAMRSPLYSGPWLRSIQSEASKIRLLGSAPSYIAHPNEAGQQGYADLLENWLTLHPEALNN